MLRWELKGEGLREQFTAASGEFMVAVEKMGNEAAGMWLESTLALLTERAKELCPVDTGFLKDSIRYEIDKPGLTGWVGADSEDENGRCYALWVEISAQGRPGRHYLEGALQSIKG